MKPNNVNYYHFTNNTLRDGRPVPKIGEWLIHEGPIEMCVSGLHASEHPFDALKYAPGAMLHLVELEEIVTRQDDKVVARKRRIVKSVDLNPLLREFARKQALSVIKNWQAPKVVIDYLQTGDESLRSAARSATRYSARSAAESAAESAARSAAESAAGSTARYAARYAAEYAAESAAWHAARDLFKEMVDKVFEVQR